MAQLRAVLLARAGQRRFAFRSEDVLAVLPMPRLTRPPGAAPPPLVGFATIGGRTVPVVAPATLLGDPPPEAFALDAHVLLLRTREPLALAVDRASDIAVEAQVRPVPDQASANGWLEGEIGEGEATHSLVRTDRLLLEAERSRLAALADLVARREAEA